MKNKTFFQSLKTIIISCGRKTNKIILFAYFYFCYVIKILLFSILILNIPVLHYLKLIQNTTIEKKMVLIYWHNVKLYNILVYGLCLGTLFFLFHDSTLSVSTFRNGIRHRHHICLHAMSMVSGIFINMIINDNMYFTFIFIKYY